MLSKPTKNILTVNISTYIKISKTSRHSGFHYKKDIHNLPEYSEAPATVSSHRHFSSCANFLCAWICALGIITDTV